MAPTPPHSKGMFRVDIEGVAQMYAAVGMYAGMYTELENACGLGAVVVCLSFCCCQVYVIIRCALSSKSSSISEAAALMVVLVCVLSIYCSSTPSCRSPGFLTAAGASTEYPFTTDR